MQEKENIYNNMSVVQSRKTKRFYLTTNFDMKIKCIQQHKIPCQLFSRNDRTILPDHKFLHENKMYITTRNTLLVVQSK